jgi:hypothetical protein
VIARRQSLAYEGQGTGIRGFFIASFMVSPQQLLHQYKHHHRLIQRSAVRAHCRSFRVINRQFIFIAAHPNL